MNANPTPLPELNEVLAALVAGVRPILADTFVGAYLQGSFAVGDAREHSDVDFVFVVRADVPAAQEAALQAVHVAVYDMASDWARHLEGSYFPQDLLHRPETAGQPLLYIDNGSRVLERNAHDNTLVVRWVLHERGVTLAGPPASTLLDAVEPDALRQEVWAVMQASIEPVLANPGWVDNDWGQPYMVLNSCRMLRTLTTGEIHSKPAGAAWAKTALDPRWAGLIERADASHLHQRLLGRQTANPVDLAATLEFLQVILEAGRAAMTA